MLTENNRSKKFIKRYILNTNVMGRSKELFEDMRNKQKENDSDNNDDEDNVTIGYIYK
jgi:hypothetical protein